MKQIIGHRIALVVNAFILILSALWYYNSREIEPIIVFVASLGLLITGIFLHQKTDSKTQTADPQPQRNQVNIKGRKNILIQSGDNSQIHTGKGDQVLGDKVKKK